MWLSRSVDLTLKEENSAAMRQLRRAHRVETLDDVQRLGRASADGCKKHLKCSEAVDLILQRTKPTHNVRFLTPLLEGAMERDSLDFTERRTRKAEEDVLAGRPVTIDPTFTHKGDLRRGPSRFRRT